MKKKSPSQSAPARRSLGERGFFNLRVLVGLFIALAGVFLALLVLGFYPAKSGFAQALLSASDSPEEEDPGERAAWERLRLQDEHGRIPPNALINARPKAVSLRMPAFRPRFGVRLVRATSAVESAPSSFIPLFRTRYGSAH